MLSPYFFSFFVVFVYITFYLFTFFVFSFIVVVCRLDTFSGDVVMATSVPVSKLDASELSLIARALDLLCKSLERAKRANSGAVQAAFAGELNHANSVLSKVRNLELEV